MQWQPVFEKRFKLAEGPFWDREEGALYWVDIAGFLACRLSHGRYHQWRFAEPVSAFIRATKATRWLPWPAAFTAWIYLLRQSNRA